MSTSSGAPSRRGSASLGTKETQSFSRKEISRKDAVRWGTQFPSLGASQEIGCCHGGGGRAQPHWISEEEGLGTRVPTPSSGSWPRPRVTIYRAVTAFSEPWRGGNLGSGPDRGGGRRHPTHLKSRSRPWLWLVKRMKASMAPTHGHASHPAHSWDLWGAAGPR